MNYLASPPLVVAYALAGTMDIDMVHEPLGARSDGTPVYLRDIWPSPEEIASVVHDAVAAEMFTRDYADVFEGDDRWRAMEVPDRRHVRLGPGVHLRAQAAVLRRDARASRRRSPTSTAPGCWPCWATR